MNNFDHIKSMTVDELADLLDKALDQEREDWSPLGCYSCVNYGTHHHNESECGNCVWFGGINKWLNREYKEATRNTKTD